MDDTQPAARNNCPMHRIKRLIVRSTSIWDPERVPALLPSMQWIRELELDALDCSTTIELFPILDLCSNLTSLSVQNTSPNSHIHVHWSSETNDVPEMEPSALVPLLNSHLSVQDRANISFQTYRLLHFSAKSVNFQHSAISNLLDACPRLQSCKIFRSKLSNAEGDIIYDYSELSSITEAMYRRAALVCPQLIEFHLPPIGSWENINELDGREKDTLTLQLAQELFPQTKFFSLQCCMPRTWTPSYDLRHFLGQLTHIEIDTEPRVDLEVLNRTLGYTHSLLHLSAPNIRYYRVELSIPKSADIARSPYIVLWEDSPKRKQHSDIYSWSDYYGKNYSKKLRRINKRLNREKAVLERHLPSCAPWRCSYLQILDLGVSEISSHQETFEFIARTCSRLVDLTLRMREFWLSESWSGYLDYVRDVGAHVSRLRRPSIRPILSLGCYAVEGDGTSIWKPSTVLRLPHLKRLTIVAIEIPGMLYTHDFDFMRYYDSEGRYVSSSPKTCFWPHLEYFSIVYHDPPQVWHKDRTVLGLERLVRRMTEIRPKVFVDFKQTWE